MLDLFPYIPKYFWNFGGPIYQYAEKSQILSRVTLEYIQYKVFFGYMFKTEISKHTSLVNSSWNKIIFAPCTTSGLLAYIKQNYFQSLIIQAWKWDSKPVLLMLLDIE